MLPPTRSTLLVAVGGAAGTVLRYGATVAFPAAPDGLPAATLVENLVGAFLLAALATVLLERLPGDRTVRPLLGTGLLGGFTTFSTLSLELSTLVVEAPSVAVVYLMLTVVGGLAAGAAGIATGRLAGHRAGRR